MRSTAWRQRFAVDRCIHLAVAEMQASAAAPRARRSRASESARRRSVTRAKPRWQRPFGMGQLGHPPRAASCSDSRAIRWSTSSRRRRPATRLRSARALPARAASERGKPFAEFVHPLDDRREDRLRLRPAADGQIETLAASLDAARQAMLRAMLQLARAARAVRTRTGTAISAAAVGVGARRSAA